MTCSSKKSKAPRLVRKEFTAWLLKQKSRRAFLRVDCMYCPIAVFLAEAKGLDKPFVGSMRYNAQGYSLRDMPAWAGRFVRLFDTNLDLPTARTAREVLELV